MTSTGEDAEGDVVRRYAVTLSGSGALVLSGLWHYLAATGQVPTDGAWVIAIIPGYVLLLTGAVMGGGAPAAWVLAAIVAGLLALCGSVDYARAVRRRPGHASELRQ